jgi:mono/diheme cytochrome c family protein
MGLGVAGLAGLALLAILAVFFVSGQILGERIEAKAERLAEPSPTLLADAPRQARVQGCTNCHGEGLRGKLMLDEPWVMRIVAPNLTDIAAQASDQQLAAAIRQGIGHDGRPLFIMPSLQYSRMSDGEVAALIRFIRMQPKAEGGNPLPSFGPIGRFALAAGKFQPATARMEDYRTQAPIGLGARHAAGQRLAANGCSECHGPALYGQAMGPDGFAPDLTIAGAYDYDQFRTLLRTGKPPSGRDLGFMSDVARKDFKYLRDDEIRALYDYLQARAQKLSR